MDNAARDGGYKGICQKDWLQMKDDQRYEMIIYLAQKYSSLAEENK